MFCFCRKTEDTVPFVSSANVYAYTVLQIHGRMVPLINSGRDVGWADAVADEPDDGSRIQQTVCCFPAGTLSQRADYAFTGNEELIAIVIAANHTFWGDLLARTANVQDNPLFLKLTQQRRTVTHVGIAGQHISAAYKMHCFALLCQMNCAFTAGHAAAQHHNNGEKN